MGEHSIHAQYIKLSIYFFCAAFENGVFYSPYNSCALPALRKPSQNALFYLHG